MDFKRLTDTAQRQIIDRLVKAGYDSYFVGGCVRDVIMGREYNDIDVDTGALP